MKIIVVHNFYQLAGGEDDVFRTESAALEARGHSVKTWTESNDRVSGMNPLRLAAGTIWNSSAYRAMREMVEREAPDIVHFHNTFPLLSPSVLWGARSAGAAVVQTLHNYRLICPAAVLLRNNEHCELCVGKHFALPGVRYRCYRNDRKASAVTAAMASFHEAIGTWRRAVDAIIVLSQFARSKFLNGGLPADRLFLKPNTTRPDPGMGEGGGPLFFAGRLASSKGVDLLLRAWSNHPDLPCLEIAGDGPMADEVFSAAARDSRIRALGQVSRNSVVERMKSASALIFPSVFCEACPTSIVQALSTGLPIIASDAGAIPEFVEHGKTGWLFRRGEADALAERVRQLQLSEPAQIRAMREACRLTFEVYYQEDRNIEQLVSIYRKAIANRAAGSPHRAVFANS